MSPKSYLDLGYLPGDVAPDCKVWLKKPGFQAGKPGREKGGNFCSYPLIPGLLQGSLSLSQGVVCHDLAIDGHDLIPFHNATCRKGRLTYTWAVRGKRGVTVGPQKGPDSWVQKARIGSESTRGNN